jgi:AraC-like DNA-binding protein
VSGGGYFTQYGICAGDGPLRCHYRGEQHDHLRRYVFLVREGEFIPSSARGTVDFQSWFIEPDIIRHAAEERGQSRTPCFTQQVVEDQQIYDVVVRAIAALGQAKEALEQQEVFTGLLDVILGNYVANGRSSRDVVAHRAVRRMRDLIQDAYQEKISLDTLASHAHISKFYALRAFKLAMGVTPHEYQVFVRVSRAKQMLRAGYSSTDVAHALGFFDQSHFVRTFQQMVLLTPHQHQTGGPAIHPKIDSPMSD